MRLAWISVSGAMTFALCVTVLHFLDPDPPEYLSQFAHSTQAWLWHLGLSALIVSCLTTGFVVRSRLGHHLPGKLGAWVIMASGVAAVPVLVLQADAEDAPVTWEGNLHLAAAGVVFIGAFVSMVLVAWALNSWPPGRPLVLPASLLTVLVAVSLALFMVFHFQDDSNVAWSERALVGAQTGWVLLVARIATH